MRLLIFIFVLSYSSVFATDAVLDWGRTGHRTTGEIASKYLSKRAAKKIDALLHGASLAFVSTYADEIKSDERYKPFGPWHYVNFPFDATYDSHPKSDKGDLVQGIETCIQVLKNPLSSREDKVFYLKLLVHFVGDLHQPLHTGIAEDRGGNTFQVRWFDEGTNLHTVWDTKMIESYNMSYSELSDNEQRLSKAQIKQIQEGAVVDWVHESKNLCRDIYAHTKVGDKLGYQYMYRYLTITRTQLQKGGIRLAKLLNDIFG